MSCYEFTMRSIENAAEHLDVDFGRDLPTTAADVAALAAARRLPPMSDAQYLRWVALIGETRTIPRENTDGDKPFEL